MDSFHRWTSRVLPSIFGVGMAFPPWPVLNQCRVEIWLSEYARLKLSPFEFDDEVTQLLHLESEQ